MGKRNDLIGRNLKSFIENFKYSGMSREEEIATLHNLRYILKDIERGEAYPGAMILEIDSVLKKRKEGGD